MNIGYFVLAIIAMSSLAASVSAAPRWEKNAAQLPSGMTKEKAVKVLDGIDKASAKRQRSQVGNDPVYVAAEIVRAERAESRDTVGRPGSPH
jgi:hypothetical protein